MTLRLNGSTSGYVELDCPAVGGSNTLVLPGGNGTSGQVLSTNGSGALSWANGGKILQVVQTVKSDAFTNTTKGSYVAVTGLSASITPATTGSKVLIFAEVAWDGANNYPVFLHIYRNGSRITPVGNATGFTPSDAYNTSQSPGDTRAWYDQQTLIYLDSPATTSATTYQVYAAKPTAAVSNIAINTFGSSNITLLEVAA